MIKDFPRTIKATLSKGLDVRARIELPKGAFLEFPSARLLDGKGRVVNQPILDYEKNELLCTSLAPGAYTLSIRSSAEQRKEMYEDAPVSDEILLKPREVAEWKGATKRFEITGNSPEVVDLGIIRVEGLPSTAQQPRVARA